MSFIRRSERNRDTYFRGYQPTVKRPAILGGVYTYRTKFSRIPEQVRIPFADGTTAIYELRIEQPSPVIRR